jgi:hypothetical protein
MLRPVQVCAFEFHPLDIRPAGRWLSSHWNPSGYSNGYSVHYEPQ